VAEWLTVGRQLLWYELRAGLSCAAAHLLEAISAKGLKWEAQPTPFPNPVFRIMLHCWATTLTKPNAH
jgi:hypothetical protein